MSKGIEYKRLYLEQLGITAFYDSSLRECKLELNKKPTVIKEANWLITGVVSVAVLLANWTIYLTIK